MKIICWNVRGAKKAQILEEVKFLKHLHKPDIMFLLETLTNDINSHNIIRRMGFRHFDYIPPSNHSGGIWVLWTNDRIQAAILSKENRAIHLLVHDPHCNQNCIISGVYGPAKEADKDTFWNHLTNLNSVFDLPWLLLGDFNELESANEKRGGRPVSLRRIGRLPNFLRASQCESVRSRAILFPGNNVFTVHGFMNVLIVDWPGEILDHFILISRYSTVPSPFLTIALLYLVQTIKTILGKPTRFDSRIFGRNIHRYYIWLRTSGVLQYQERICFASCID